MRRRAGRAGMLGDWWKSLTSLALALQQCIFVMLQHRRHLQCSEVRLGIIQAPQKLTGKEGVIS